MCYGQWASHQVKHNQAYGFGRTNLCMRISLYKFKLKGVWSLTYHLGCEYFNDTDGTLCYGPRKYIDKIMGQYENMFGCKPREYTSPLEKGNHLEVDCSDEFDEVGIKRYQTMIGCLQ
jgi:hypothetical protein